MEIKTIRELKDDFAKEKGYDGWYDYYNYCKSNGFNESEIGYNDLICFCVKYHVNLALQSAIKNAELIKDGRKTEYLPTGSGFKSTKVLAPIYKIKENSILNAYPLNNIQ